ncbi:TPA: arginine--tRNA ligase [Candidatus Micrarchaeota archaeon]|nr:arginine--tRNA ligase [Candidatus Micrarchaeota archaeon]
MEKSYMTGLSAVEKAVSEAKELVAQELKRLGSRALASVERPRQREQGDLAFACFAAAKELSRNSKELAEKMAAEITPRLGEEFARCEAVNGFVNFFFSEGLLDSAVSEALKQGPKYGSGTEGNGKTVTIDYSSPNVGKPLHVGHIRSTILGDSIKRLLRLRGYNAIGSNYLCEAGTQVAMLLVGLRKYGATNIRDEKELVDYYVRINKEIEGNPELKEEVRTALEGMEDGDAQVEKELKRVRELSLAPLEKNYELLGVSFEEEIFDSSLSLPAKAAAAEAVKKGIAFKDKNGETVADLEHYGLPNLVILRSNGTTLYSTRDLALADWRWKKHGFDKCIYVTGSDQNAHFRQFFKILEILGRPYSKRLQHVGYGLISLPEGKFSTRKGRIVFLSDLLDDATQEAKNEILARRQKTEERTGEEYSEKEMNKAAAAVGVGATKFAFLRVGADKNIVFDTKRVVSFEGDTGAYVQYTLVRCRNILHKAGELKPALKGGMQEEERRLARTLADYPLTMKAAARSLAPHSVCDYLLKLCADFSSFYESCPVLKAETKQAAVRRLALVKTTATVLENGLEILGIVAPKKM